MIKKGELLIFPCAFGGEKAAGERWQAEGLGCPAGKKSPLLSGVLKVSKFPIGQMDIMGGNWAIVIWLVQP